jgi:ribosomal protein S27E
LSPARRPRNRRRNAASSVIEVKWMPCLPLRRVKKGCDVMSNPTRIKLNCISCGHVQELSEAYENYQGQIRCWGCSTTLDVSIIEGKLQSMQLHDDAAVCLTPLPPPAPAIEVLVVSEERKPRKTR